MTKVDRLSFAPALLIAVHGLLFWLYVAAGLYAAGGLPEFVQAGCLFVLVFPAMILLWPFNGIFWEFHLMESPGWFAWPKPVAVVLGYCAWVVVFVLLALVVQVLRARRDA